MKNWIHFLDCSRTNSLQLCPSIVAHPSFLPFTGVISKTHHRNVYLCVGGVPTKAQSLASPLRNHREGEHVRVRAATGRERASPCGPERGAEDSNPHQKEEQREVYKIWGRNSGAELCSTT